MAHFYAGFRADGHVVRVRFEPGSRAALAEEVELLSASRALVLTTPEQVRQGEEIISSLGERAAGLFSEATMHTPVGITEKAMRAAEKCGADCVISIGGGSTIGLGKAIAYRTDMPQIAVPTTYAGSEATPILGQTEDGVKTTLNSPSVQPEVIVYDPELVATLPSALTVTSGLNAIAHSIEGIYACDGNRLNTALALDGVRAFVSGLPKVVQDPTNLEARSDTLFGAWLCGTVLGTVGMSLHHKLCHALGGALNLPHAETHAIILPHAVAYNEVAVRDQLSPVAQIFDADSAAAGLYRFAKQLNAPTALKSLGVKEADLDQIADLASKNPYWNPRPIERDAIRVLLQRAYLGSEPSL